MIYASWFKVTNYKNETMKSVFFTSFSETHLMAYHPSNPHLLTVYRISYKATSTNHWKSSQRMWIVDGGEQRMLSFVHPLREPLLCWCVWRLVVNCTEMKSRCKTQTSFSNFWKALPYFWSSINTEKYICVLAFKCVRENTVSSLFHEKWFHTIVVNFEKWAPSSPFY